MKTRDIYPTGTGTGGPETDPIATAAIKKLSDAVALLPPFSALDPIKADIVAIQDAAKDFASKADLVATNALLTTVSDAVKQYQTSGSPAAFQALQDAITKANADIAAIKAKQDEHAVALQKATQAIADLAILVAGGAGGAGANSAAVTALQTRLTALETSKADKTQLDTLTQSVTDLETAIKTGATDQEVTDAIAVVDKTITDLETALKAADDALAAKIKANADNIEVNKKAIADLQKKTTAVIRYGSTDTAIQDLDHWAIVDGATALTLPSSTLNRFVGINMLQSATVPELTAAASEQFFVFDGDKVVASTDGKGTLDQPHSLVLLFGRAAGGWDVVFAGGNSGSAGIAAEADPVALAALQTAKTELTAAIADKALTADVTASITAIQTSIDAITASKADKATVDAANKAIADLNAALAQNDATDADIAAAVKKAEDAIAALQKTEFAGFGKTLDLLAIKQTSSGFYNGADLAGGPENSGSEGVGAWSYTGDDTNGTLWLHVVWSPGNRGIEGFWTINRAAKTWGSWVVAPKATDYVVTTGNRTVFTGEYVAIAPGHTVDLTYLNVNKTIRLKPTTTWPAVIQPTSQAGAVPAKPTTGSEPIELKFNAGKGEWELVPAPVDPMDTRVKAVETSTTSNTTRIATLEAEINGTNHTNNDYFLDGGLLYTANEDIGLLSLVHRLPDNKIELATDANASKPADGIVLSSVASGGTTKVLSTGGRLTDLGLVGISAGQRIYLGTDGNKSTSSTGTGRFIQDVAVFTGTFYRLDFRDSGYWIAP